MATKINKRQKYLKVTEVFTFPNGEVRLVLADGRELSVQRRTRVYSSASVSSSDRPADGHQLRVVELAGKDSIAF